jgi:hypothetical protein
MTELSLTINITHSPYDQFKTQATDIINQGLLYINTEYDQTYSQILKDKLEKLPEDQKIKLTTGSISIHELLGLNHD